MIKMKNVCKTYEGFQFDLSMEIPNGGSQVWLERMEPEKVQRLN